ncbi:tetratricopeptide repeat protein [Streptomyces sp. BR123]|uniref:tetratricopeptide repeat protein n=1 Tax=Streptomyces sp. BR123 TaxID=2749828 RepID=UPI0015C4DAF4|nr:tetratricopeptide repeat protein [Streptomyces sp. BR123]NXY94291.1 tetratricopeptide repeat protein [Streptomyces sp. BR123]
MTMTTHEEIRRGLAENHKAPNGTARNTHAEALVAAAEALGDTALFRDTLDNLVRAYLWSSESSKMLVPFARLLQEYDKDPGSFTKPDAHSLFWKFKWAASAISDSPEIPLESAWGWIAEMERRYRIAGYGERPVRKAEMWLAHSTGDDERADRAHRDWLAADRDSMSDCRACELNSQGNYTALRGDDAQALEHWKPVLAGDRTCAEEPHRVLSASLLPLLRLGRLDEARAHHLRGYRMARGIESLLPTIARHIEFCALSGNESRGLEILAEHAAHLGPLANVDDQLAFHGGILVLLRRLKELGHGDSPAASYEGVPRTVSELYEQMYAGSLAIARRFDARNGTTRTSDRFLARIGAQPLVGVLPLGVRSAPLPQTQSTAAAAVVPGAAVPTAAGGPTAAITPEAAFADLVEQARQARDQGRPAADGLWAEVAVRMDARPAEGVDALVAADVADSRALAAARAGAPEAAELLEAVRDRYRALGQDQRAALAELRLASVAGQCGAEPDRVRELLAAAARAAAALDPGEPLRARRIASAELASLRIEPYLRSRETGHRHAHGNGHDHAHHDPEHDHGQRELAAFAEAHAQTLPDLAADAEELLGRVALSQGDPERAVVLLGSAARRVAEAGRPWLAVDPLVLRAGLLMSLGRAEEAEEAARSAVEFTVEITDAETQAAARLTLADILLRRADTAAEAAEHALTAAHWFDHAGLAALGGAQARFALATAYAREGRVSDAAEVLQSALPDLLDHGDLQAVSAREFLGDLLRQLNEPRAAAEQFLLAAEVAKGWDGRRPEADLAHSAADQLASAQLPEEAVAAYERALELHRMNGGAPVAEVRILRSLAWLALREGAFGASVARARFLMDEAAGVLEAALSSDPEDLGLRAELARTWHQLAQVLDRQVTAAEHVDDEYGEGDEDARRAERLAAAETWDLRLEEIALCERAADVYAELGPDHLEDRLQCVQYAAWTEQELGRDEEGAARVSALVDELRELPEGTADGLLERAEYTLERLSAS